LTVTGNGSDWPAGRLATSRNGRFGARGPSIPVNSLSFFSFRANTTRTGPVSACDRVLTVTLARNVLPVPLPVSGVMTSWTCDCGMLLPDGRLFTGVAVARLTLVPEEDPVGVCVRVGVPLGVGPVVGVGVPANNTVAVAGALFFLPSLTRNETVRE